MENVLATSIGDDVKIGAGFTIVSNEIGSHFHFHSRPNDHTSGTYYGKANAPDSRCDGEHAI